MGKSDKEFQDFYKLVEGSDVMKLIMLASLEEDKELNRIMTKAAISLAKEEACPSVSPIFITDFVEKAIEYAKKLNLKSKEINELN